ncbi:hypothetical protein C9994_04185 [Marivirga lumbricoides]|uniref:Peptidase C14 caspase domain-containing protein n=1 Tax=Marivirga lumbricoides TaxID=1046115 RepID=A0A2T4DTJ2_9BACT|nr:hypothetical protein C9994_04185 [Marivirga lumbricoides]
MKKAILFSVPCFLFLVLSHKLQSQSLTLNLQKGHSEVVKTVQLSEDGRYLFTGSRDKTIKMWDAESGLEIRTLFGHEHTINNISIDKKGRIASSSADMTVNIWDHSTGEILWTSPKAKDFLTDVAFAPNGKQLALGGYENHVVIYDWQSGDSLKALPVNSDKGTGYGVALTWSSDGAYLAIGEDNKELSLYDTKSWELVYQLKPENGWCGGCPTLGAINPKSTLIAKLSENGDLDLLELTSGKLLKKLKSEWDDIRSVAFSKDGKKLLAADREQVFVYDVISYQQIAMLKPDVMEINEAIFNHESDAIIVGGNDNRATEIDIKSGEVKQQFQGLLHQQDKGGLLYDPNNYWESYIARYIKNKNIQLLTSDGQYLLKGKIGNVLRMWEVKTGKPVVEFAGHSKSVISFSLSPDEKQIASGGGEGNVIIWEKRSGTALKILKGHSSPVFDVRWSPDQSKIVSTSWDGQVLVWDVETGKAISGIYWKNASAYSATFTKDGLYLIVARLDQKLELYEVETGLLVKTFIGHTENVNDIILSDKPEEFITLSNDGKAITWNLYDGMMRKKYHHPTGAIRAGALQDDKIYTGGDDRNIYIWNREKGDLLQKLEGHQAGISSLNIDEKGSLLISGDLDGVTKFWDLKTGEEILEHIIIDKANWVTRNPAGYFYATDGAQQYVHYVKGNEAYLLDQFFDEFYTPQLIKKTFSGKETKSKKNLQGLLDKSELPEVKIAGTMSDDQLKATIHLKVTNDEHLKELQLFHNSKRVGIGIRDFKKSRQEDNSTIFSVEQPLVSGHNRFIVRALNNEKIASAPAEVDLITDNSVPGATCHLLVIGVNEYKNPELNLNYAKADAESFSKEMKAQSRYLFSSFKSYELYNEKATKANILATMDTIIVNAAIDDLFVLYFAGHGSMSDDTFYFIPHESTRLYEGEALRKQALSAETMQQKLTLLKALKQIVFIDACQSGGSVELLAQRGAPQEKAIAQLSRSAGVHILSAAGSEQFASEFADLGHGVFTYALLEAIRGSADGAPEDGKVTVFEMKSFIDELVPELNMKLKGKPQYPYTFSRGNDFPIGILQKEKE